MKKFNKKGFTLIEMLVVIAVIAVLVSIVIPTVTDATAKAKYATDAANLRSVAATAASEYLGNGSVTSTLTVDAKSVTSPSVEVYVEGGAIKAYIKSGDNYYSVDNFANAATDGSLETSTPSNSGTKIYPVA